MGAERPYVVSGYRIDEAEIRRAWELYIPAGQVTELRALNCSIRGERRSGTYSGYFDAQDEFIAAVRKIEAASAVYFVPNAINPALLARSHNRARIVTREPLTADADISRRRWLLIDIDSIRPAGVSATAGEKGAAEGLATAIDAHLHDLGFPAGIIADSGNGCHITIPVDLPADDGGWCERILKMLDRAFSNEFAHIDTAVHNPARIWKLPGTMSCKGDNVASLGRPWRMSRILQVCNQVGRMG